MARRIASAPPPERIAPVPDLDPAQLEFERLLVAAVERKAKRARVDGAEFFSFVMKEERAPSFDAGAAADLFRQPDARKASVEDRPAQGRKKLACAPHQRVLLSFVEAHPRCVLRMPAGSSKTYCMVSEALRALGNDPTERGAVISATQDGAKRPLGMVRDYIENKEGAFPELRMVYPALRPSTRLGDAWRQDALVVERPAGIRDHSLVAVGIDGGSLPGSRLSWILVDDLVNEENSRTAERRKAVASWFYSTVLSRDDVGTARIVVANTPWVDGGETPDLTFVLERAGWPTLTMDVEGNVWVTNADPKWDTDDLRPATRRVPLVIAKAEGEIEEVPFSRLAAHDAPAYAAQGALPCVSNDNGRGWRGANDADLEAPGVRPRWLDIEEVVPLWPEKWPRAWIEATRRHYAGMIHKFNQLYLCLVTDEDESRCKVEWVESCKKLGAEMGHRGLVQAYEGSDLVVTGVDLAFGTGRRSDQTAFFTFQSMPDGKRKVLDIEAGRWTGDEIVARLIDKQHRYRSLVRVETNGGANFLRQWALERNASLPVRAHFTTGKNKSHPVYGLESIFMAFANRAWIVPVDEAGNVHPFVQKWLDACVYYQPPPAHTPDLAIACWLACEQEREITRGRPREQGQGASISAGVFAR